MAGERKCSRPSRIYRGAVRPRGLIGFKTAVNLRSSEIASLNFATKTKLINSPGCCRPLKELFGLIGIDFYPTNMPPKSSQWNLCLPLRPTVLRNWNELSNNFTGWPSQNVGACRVATLDAVVPAEQHNTHWRCLQNRLQFGTGHPQFSGPFVYFVSSSFCV